MQIFSYLCSLFFDVTKTNVDYNKRKYLPQITRITQIILLGVIIVGK